MLSGLCCPFQGYISSVVPFLEPSLDKAREDASCWSEVHLVEIVQVDRGLKVDQHRPGPNAACGRRDACSRMNVTRCADDQAQISTLEGIDGGVNAVHSHWNFTEPHDVWPHPRGGRTTGAFHEGRRVKVRLGHSLLRSTVAFAAEHSELTVHGQKRGRTGTLVQVVDVLRDEQHVWPFPLKFDQGAMGSVRLDVQQSLATKRVETPNGLRIAPPRGWRGHLIDAMPFPQPVLSTEGGHTRFSRNSCSGQDHDAVWPRHGRVMARSTLNPSRSERGLKHHGHKRPP